MAERSFRDRFHWCNSARAQGLKKTKQNKTSKHAVNTAIILFTRPKLSVLFFSIIERSELIALVFCYKDMLEMGNDAKKNKMKTVLRKVC